MMVDAMTTTFDWQESAATNIEYLSTAIAKADTYSFRINNGMKGLVVTANVAYAEKQTWGSELAESQCKIKAKYLYNNVHDANSIVAMMKYLAAADKQKNRQEATAPETNGTANMVNLVIDWLQQLVQQPSEYASTNCNDESTMSATSDRESLVEKIRYRAKV